MPLPLLVIASGAPSAFQLAKSFLMTTNLNIAVLGAKASGKTTLIDILRTGEVGTVSQATSFEEKIDEIDASWTKENKIEKTKILINEKKSSFFKKIASKVSDSVGLKNLSDSFKNTGVDVPGDESFRQTYEEYIVGKDIVLLLFDVSLYFNPEWDSKDGGKREIQALMDFVYDRKETLSSKGKVVLLATHKDVVDKTRYPNDSDILFAFRQSLKGKPYADLALDCHCVNLLHQDILETIKNICEGT